MILVLGLSILIGFFIRRGIDRKNELQLMASFEERLAKLKDSGLDHHYTGGTVETPEYSEMSYLNGDVIAILSLDRLGIKVAVTEGVGKETLRISAGHFPGGDMPGEGNFSVAGHSSFVYTCLFNDLHKAVEGDEIDVFTEKGRFRYIVTDVMSVSPDRVDLVDHTDKSILTIVTCNSGGTERLIIRGIEKTE